MAAQNEFMGSLCKICENVASTLNYTEALTLLVKNAAKYIGAKASSIRMLDKTGTALEIVATYGLSKTYLEKGPVEVGKSAIDKMALAGEIVQIKDVSRDERVQYPEEAEREGIKSVLFLPLKYKGRAIGVLRIYMQNEHEFSKSEVDFISAIATQGAIAIKNAQRYNRLKSFYEIGKTITSELKLPKVLELICQSAANDLKAIGASIMMLDTESGTLSAVSSVGLRESFLKKGPVEVDKSIKSCLEGNPVVIEDTATDKRIQYPDQVGKEGIKSIICVPLKLKEKVIGMLRVYTGYRYKEDEEDIEFLSILADFGTVAVENARLYEHVEKEYEELTRDVWKWYDWGERAPRI
ncbi:MAG: GAF domain-containing protein [Actinobacteria bacterium]|nr:GAF domain-containing protein [Actinomycetota bacterium]